MLTYRKYVLFLAAMFLLTSLVSPVFGQTDGMGNPLDHIRVNLNSETGLIS